MLGEQADLEAEVSSLPRGGGSPVLADEDECGEEDRFHGRPGGEDHECGIERPHAGDKVEIDQDPPGEQRKMYVNEGHAAGEPGDQLCNLRLDACTALLISLAVLQSLDVPFKG